MSKTVKRKIRRAKRLTSFITPLRYKLQIAPDLENFTFEGNEIIFVILKKTTSRIIIHSKELDIEVAEIVSGKSKIFAKKITYDKKSETAILQFPKNISKGKARLRLHFRGILNDKMIGFYRSSHSHKGKTKYIATTQFESTYARHAFPCFDEPAAKAVFDVQITIPSHLTAISNTLPTKTWEQKAGYTTHRFFPTPKMSTYLLAFIVGDFEYIEKQTKTGVSVKVYTTPGKKHQAVFALKCAVKMLEFYEKYFAIKYPLNTLDLIAIPDFSAGAMENWGAVTYRESALLIDPKHSAPLSKQFVAEVIGHELAHQWFGNLVTMEWWTHLWLNEGFATYIEYLAVNHVFPKWNIWNSFVSDDFNVALKLDSLSSTHPIEVDVHHPDDISEIFDRVSYAKGASIIRMLANYLGERNFRDGLRYYLKKHSYKNTSTIHLWEAFEKTSGKPVRSIMNEWTRKSGYPLLRIYDNEKTLELRQARFFSSPISKKKTEDRTKWKIPFQIVTSKGSKRNILMKDRRLQINKTNDAWIKINSGETSFFRTDYPESLWRNFQKPIRKNELSVENRLGIIRDAFALAESGNSSTVEALSLSRNYIGETEYVVWSELSDGINRVYSLVVNEKCAKKYKKFAVKLFRSITKRVGWRKKSGESHSTSLLRNLAIYHSGIYGDKKIIERARKLFWAKNPVPPDIRGAVYAIVATYGGLREHKKLIAMYKEEELHEEKNRIGRALGSFQNDSLLKKSLEFYMSRHVRFQDTAGMIVSAWLNPAHRKLAWGFVKKNWNIFLSRYGVGGHTLPWLIKYAENFTKSSQAKQVIRFFKSNQAPGAKRTIQQAIEKIYSNEVWLARDKKKIEQWLELQEQN